MAQPPPLACHSHVDGIEQLLSARSQCSTTAPEYNIDIFVDHHHPLLVPCNAKSSLDLAPSFRVC